MKDTVQLFTSKASFPLLCPDCCPWHARGVPFLQGFSKDCSVWCCHTTASAIPGLGTNFINQPPLLMSWPSVRWQTGDVLESQFAAMEVCHVLRKLVQQRCTFF